MLFAMERELQSTCRNLGQKEQQQIRDLIRSLQRTCLIRKIYSTLNEILRRVAPTVMVRVLFISILHIPIFLILSKLPGMNFLDQKMHRSRSPRLV
ncbi:MAG: hypothetical protein CM15mP103_08560 [Gammaproteobacteria bacterium]|nr:MAG: hypothetical protein CM15mP103_08560 [Gammaproteobacteria bacterium]